MARDAPADTELVFGYGSLVFDLSFGPTRELSPEGFVCDLVGYRRRFDIAMDNAVRWTAAGMLEAERQFRRVKGHRELPLLLAALRREMHPTEEAATVRAG